MAKSADEQRLEDIKAELNKCPTGQHTVSYIESKKLPVEFKSGGGSYWDGKRIVLDRTESPQLSALTMVHEGHHAEQQLDGPAADAKKETRKDYVDKRIEEEAVGTVKSIQAKNELVARGEKISETFPLEAEYNQAYKNAQDQLRKNNPKATEHELDAGGRTAGLDAVRQGFNDGAVVTSTDNRPYRDYYGDDWDRSRGLAKPGPALGKPETEPSHPPPPRSAAIGGPGAPPPRSADTGGPGGPPPQRSANTRGPDGPPPSAPADRAAQESPSAPQHQPPSQQRGRSGPSR